MPQTRSPDDDPNPPTLAGAPTSRPLDEVPELAEAAARLLRAPTATLDLTEAEARVVAGCMRLKNYPRGATLLRQGDKSNTSYMLLLITGEVTVDTVDSGQTDMVAISVLGPGNLIGELGMLDGAARSASCTAASAVQAASLSRSGLQKLIAERPAVAAKLMAAISRRIAERLRALTEQLQMYAQLTAAQAGEIERLKLQRGPVRGPKG